MFTTTENFVSFIIGFGFLNLLLALLNPSYRIFSIVIFVVFLIYKINRLKKKKERGELTIQISPVCQVNSEKRRFTLICPKLPLKVIILYPMKVSRFMSERI